MEKSEYLELISRNDIDMVKVTEIETIYGCTLSEIARKLISNCDEALFFDNGTRILAFDEIINAEIDLHIDFKDKGLIPVADCGNNDFIVYHFNDDIWSKFNIIDETVFKKRNELSELL